jgi:hypothetical protein
VLTSRITKRFRRRLGYVRYFLRRFGIVSCHRFGASELAVLDRFVVLVSWRMNKHAYCDRWNASHSIFCGRHYRQNVPGGLVLNDLSVLERRSNKALQTTPRGRFGFFHSFFGLPGRPWFGASELVSLGHFGCHALQHPSTSLGLLILVCGCRSVIPMSGDFAGCV